MKKSFGKIAIASTAFACATLISFDWSAQQGVSLSVESAQARIGRPLTPLSGAGVARRQYRRAAYGYGYGAGVIGTGLAVGAAATVAAATSPWGYGYYGGRPYGYQAAGYYASDPNAAYASSDQTLGGGYYAGGYYGESPWGYYECRLPHAYNCQPYSHIGWYHQ
jgi:hypothetical protein